MTSQEPDTGGSGRSTVVGVPVRYFRDALAGTWGFAIANPSVLGGPHATLAEAEAAAAEALARALHHHGWAGGPGETRLLLVSVETPEGGAGPAAPAVPERRRAPEAAVGEAMTRAVVTVGPAVRRADIVAALRRFAVGALPVVDADHRPLGVVSEADILAVQHDPAAAVATAEALMTAPAVTVAEEQTQRAAAELMRRENVRRLVVVDARGRLCGVVSRRDLLLP